MSLKDYYKPLIKRVVIQVSDGGGSYTETFTDSDIEGYLALLNSYEQTMSAQKKLFTVARLFTEELISERDRIIDGTTIYEVVGVYDFFHKFYDLKKVN